MTFYNQHVNLFSNINNVHLNKITFKSDAQFYKTAQTEKSDSYSSNPILSSQNKSDIEMLAKSNPRLMEILKDNNIPLKVNTKELEDLKKNHLLNTRVVIAKMYSELPKDLKQNINLSDIQEAAMLHDYGKVLIPKEILNKDNTLNPSEKQIMDLHSEIGYELLKTQGVKPSVLNLVKYHHQTPSGDGYPSFDNNNEYNIEIAMLAAADKYTALTENRSYKSAMQKDEALKIIEEDVKAGILPEEVFNALKKAVN